MIRTSSFGNSDTSVDQSISATGMTSTLTSRGSFGYYKIIQGLFYST